VAQLATKTEIRQAVQSIFKSEGCSSVRTATIRGKTHAAGKVAGYRPDLKKAYVRVEDRARRCREYRAATFKFVVDPVGPCRATQRPEKKLEA